MKLISWKKHAMLSAVVYGLVCCANAVPEVPERPNAPSELPDSASKLIHTLTGSGADFTVLMPRLDYVKKSDLPYLVGLLDSTEPCGHVNLAINSIRYPGKSTVGREAAYLIEGFWKRYYPTQLDSGQYKPDIEGIKRWYQMWSHLKKLAEQDSAANSHQPETEP